jgi:hypothetical protein
MARTKRTAGTYDFEPKEISADAHRTSIKIFRWESRLKGTGLKQGKPIAAETIRGKAEDFNKMVRTARARVRELNAQSVVPA